MAHVSSYSQEDEDGIFLYDKHKRRIGGPYPSNDAADAASKAASDELGEAPREAYIEFFRQNNPGILGGQSPIPETYRGLYAPPLAPGLLDLPLKEKKGSHLDAFISPAESQYQQMSGSTFDPLLGSDSPINYEALGIIPTEAYNNLFNTDFVTDIRKPRLDIPIDTGWKNRPQGFPANMEDVKVIDSDIEEIIRSAADKAGVRAAYTDGHRTPEQNAIAGGSRVSKHLTGNAFDLKLSGDYAKDWLYYTLLRAELSPLGYWVGFFPDPDKNHIHIQKPRKGE